LIKIAAGNGTKKYTQERRGGGNNFQQQLMESLFQTVSNDEKNFRPNDLHIAAAGPAPQQSSRVCRHTHQSIPYYWWVVRYNIYILVW
jgi:hypothetical protein